MNPLFAILLDGAFVQKKLQERLGHFPTADDIMAECARIKAHPSLANYDLLRIYFYHARPAVGTLTNPIDRSRLNLDTTSVRAQYIRLLDSLEMKPDVALRLGEAIVQGWRLGNAALRRIGKTGGTIAAGDMVPNITQKGVDLRIGLDIARLSLKQLVRIVVVGTGDSDLVPAFKFARREGIRVYLDHMGHPIRRDLKVHTDLIL